MIYAFLANGFEETEAIVPIDLIRRCEKDLVTVGIGGQIIKGSHGIPVFADIEEREIVLDENLEMIILPGGMPGTINLEKSEYVQKAVDFCVENNIPIASICAAPSILGHKGLLDGKKACCYTGYDTQLGEAIYDADAKVCVDGNFITARGAGVALEFGLALVEKLISKERCEILKASLLC